MNLTTVTSIPSSNWKRFTTHSIAAAAGVALAISAVAAFGSSTSGQTSAAPSREASVPSITREAMYENVSNADVLASALSGEMATYDFSGTQPAQRQASAADIDAATLSSEMATYDWTVSAPRQVSRADIAASVLSTELANFGGVDSAPRGTLIQPFSAEYAQYISLQEQVLVALDGTAFPRERVSAEYAEYITLQEQVLVTLSGNGSVQSLR